MRLIISFILAALMVSCATPPARSQADFLVVQTCGTLPLAYAPGAVRLGTIDVNGKLCDTGSAATSDATAANQVLQITQATATNTLLGVQADAACATDNGTCTLAALTKRNNQRLTTINTTLGTPMQATGGTVGLVAGTAIAGKFGIDQTTPGTTNAVAPIAGQAGVQGGAGASTALTQRVAIATDANTVSLAANQSVNVAQINAVIPLMGNGATGTGSPRVTIASDNTLPTGWASSTAANQTATQAPVAPATATATKSDLVGCQATTAAVNPTTGQQGACSSDTNNNILVSAGGAPNLSVSQVSVTTSDTAVVSARALRRAVTIQQITGTQNVFCNQTTATAANGLVLPAVVGASITLNTTSAVRCIAITGAQTVAVAETF